MDSRLFQVSANTLIGIETLGQLLLDDSKFKEIKSATCKHVGKPDANGFISHKVMNKLAAKNTEKPSPARNRMNNLDPLQDQKSS